MTQELQMVREAQAADPSPRRLRSGLNAMNVRMFVHPGSGARAVLEAPVYRTFPRARMDLLRYRAVAYDRLVGDIVPSVVPFGYLGVVEDGDPVLLTDRAAGPPVPRGARGWVFAHVEDDGRVAVDSCRAAGADRTRWGTSTRSLLGLRPDPLEGARLWSLGDRAVWLRQEHGHRRTVPLRRDDAEPWPRALVADLFFSALCTLMLDDAPVPGLPPGVVVHLDAGESLIVGLAATPEELAAFLREDHVAHHLLAPSVTPDVVTLAKGLGGGVPIGAVVATGPAACLLGPGQHGTTFGGNPVACAAALAVIATIRDEGLRERASALGARWSAELAAVPGVTGVRGRGLLRGVGLADAVGPAAAVAAELMERGFIVNAPRPDTLRLAPPLILPDADADRFTAVLRRVLADRLTQAGPA